LWGEDALPSVRLVETPRELVYGEHDATSKKENDVSPLQPSKPSAAIHFVTPMADTLEVILSDLAEEVRAVADGAIETALEVHF
jgi:hypothetical protein